MVVSMSASVCALETNPASNAEGARNTPRASAAPFLRPSGRDPEAGHRLVEDQQGAVAVAQRAERRVELRLGRDEPAVPDVRLDDHGGQRVTPSPEQLAEGAAVVEGQREGETGKRGGDAGAVG